MGDRPVSEDDWAIGVLARAPAPGACKTRLASLIGDAGAARLQQQLITHTLRTACASAPGRVTLFTAGDAPQAPWSRWRRRFGVRVMPQVGGDLGSRMHGALAHLLRQAARALLIGTDCPALGVGDLQAAAQALTRARMVFVPAEDGGYVLVGARQINAGAFAGIPWGTAHVMACTRAVLAADAWRAGRDWLEMPALWDVDRPDDLRRAVDAGLLPARLLEASVPERAGHPSNGNSDE